MHTPYIYFLGILYLNLEYEMSRGQKSIKQNKVIFQFVVSCWAHNCRNSWHCPSGVRYCKGIAFIALMKPTFPTRSVQQDAQRPRIMLQSGALPLQKQYLSIYALIALQMIYLCIYIFQIYFQSNVGFKWPQKEMMDKRIWITLNIFFYH